MPGNDVGRCLPLHFGDETLKDMPSPGESRHVSTPQSETSNAGAWTEERLAATALIGILLVAAALRFNGLMTEGLRFDESYSWDQARSDIPTLFVRTFRDNYPPLHNLILWSAMHLTGEAEWSLRWPSVLLGIATVAITFFIGRRYGGLPVAIAASVLLAVSPVFIWYSQDGRMYPLFAFGSALLCLAILRYAEHPGRRRAAIAALATLILLYSHILAPITWVALAGIGLFVIPRGGRRSFILWQAGAWLLFAPWLLVSLRQTGKILKAGFWIPPISPQSFFDQLAQLAGGPLPLIALAATVVLGLWPSRARATSLPHKALLVTWLALPVAALTLISVFVLPMFLARYMVALLPCLYLLAAIGVVRLADQTRPSRPLAVFAAALIGLSLTLGQGLPARPDWRHAAQFVASNLRPGDCVSVLPSWDEVPLNYYFRHDGTCGLTKDWTPASLDLRSRMILVVGEPGDPTGISRTAEIRQLMNAAGWNEIRLPYLLIDIYVFSREG